jgi:predicted metal-binding protein
MIFQLHLEEYNFREYKEFDLGLIRIDQAVRDSCRKNACGQYGKNHRCPPAIKETRVDNVNGLRKGTFFPSSTGR